MPLFGPPNIEKLEAKRDTDGLIKALGYRKDGDTPRDPVPGAAPVRRAAAEALGRIADPRATGALIVTLNDAHPDVRRAAEGALIAIGDYAVGALVAALTSRDGPVLQGAARILGQSRDARAAEPLVRAMRERDGWRAHFAEALVEIDAPAVTPLLVALADRDEKLASAAATALGRIAARQQDADVCSHAAEGLVDALGHVREPVRRAAGDALVAIGEPAIEPLIAALQDRSETVRTGATGALDRLGWQPDRGEAGARYWVSQRQWARAARLGGAAVAPLAAALQVGEVETRGKAADALGKTGDPRAVEPLIAALDDRSAGVRWAAADALARMADARAVDRLMEALEDPEMAVRQSAAEALVQIAQRQPDAALRERIAEPLARALSHRDAAMRDLAAAALEKLGWHPDEDAGRVAYWIAQRQWERCAEMGAPAVGPLIAALGDSDADARRGAAEALGRMGDPRAAEPLAVLLRKDAVVRQAAAQALVRMGAPAVGPLIATLAAEGGTEEGRQAALDALVGIGTPAVEPLIAALGQRYARTGAATALGRIAGQRTGGDALPGAVKPLIVALRDSAFWHRQAAAKALGLIGDPQAVTPLTARLSDEHPQVREAASRALERLGWEPNAGTGGAAYWVLQRQWERCVAIGAPAVEPLMVALRDPDETVRTGAAQALTRIGAPAVEALIRTLQDRDAGLRLAAVRVLGDLSAQLKDAALRARLAGPLISALQDRDAAVRCEATRVLGQMGTRKLETVLHAQVVEALIAALQDKEARIIASQALGLIGDRRAVEPLIAALKSKAPGFREAAVEALGEIGDRRAAPALVSLYVKDPDANQAAAAVLWKLGAPAAAPLAAVLADEKASEEQLNAVAGLLVHIGEPAVEPLLRAMDRFSKPAVETLSSNMRHSQALSMVIRVLGEIQDPRAVEPLIPALANEVGSVSCAAAEALGQIGDARALAPLMAALGAQYDELRLQAAKSLVAMYASGRLSEQAAARVLTLRSAIGAAHIDAEHHSDYGGSGNCHSDEGYWHEDRGVDFPL